jgi:hypothetical protein
MLTGLRNEDEDHILAGEMPLHPGKSYRTCLFYEPCIDTAKEVRLTAPAESLEGVGTVYLRGPIKSNPRRINFSEGDVGGADGHAGCNGEGQANRKASRSRSGQNARLQGDFASGDSEIKSPPASKATHPR